MWKVLWIFAYIGISLITSAPKPQKQFYQIKKAESYFQEFVIKFNKTYATQKEKDLRFMIFKDNLKLINKYNRESDDAVFGITVFTDITTEERKKKYTGFKQANITYCELIPKRKKMSLRTPPKSLDWRKKGVVTEVQSQINCGSCWAFSVIGNLEGQYAIKHKELKEFSVQQLVDCDEYNYGCSGGYPGNAILWLKKHGGIMSYAGYPYNGLEKDCKFDQKKAIAQVEDCYQYHPRNEEELKQILAEVGPLSIAVDSSRFETYFGGIFDCQDRNKPDHAMLLVGYGKEGDRPYWIVKNSYGNDWGEEGYMRLEMYKNSCNMLSTITSAVLKV